jgi:hypothetical protein
MQWARQTDENAHGVPENPLYQPAVYMKWARLHSQIGERGADVTWRTKDEAIDKADRAREFRQSTQQQARGATTLPAQQHHIRGPAWRRDLRQAEKRSFCLVTGICRGQRKPCFGPCGLVFSGYGQNGF